jgi:hypothetical protein
MNADDALRTHPSRILFLKRMFYHRIFRFELPWISVDIVCNDIAETERFEGDAVADIVMKLHPGSNPH